MTLPFWMRGCMAGLMLTLPGRSSGQALASGDHCGMCGLGPQDQLRAFSHGLGVLSTNRSLSVSTPRVPKGSISSMSSMWLPARLLASVIGPVAHLSNAEQATGIIEPLEFEAGDHEGVADDAVFNATGSDRGSTAGDFRGGVR